jgi:hypothetical protein
MRSPARLDHARELSSEREHSEADSAQLEVAPDQESLGVALRRTSNATAPRDTTVRIEVRDTLTEEVIDATDSVLAVDLDDW